MILVEVKALVMAQGAKDGRLAVRLPTLLDSESAPIIIELGVTREALRVALSEPRERHSAQVDLLNVI